MNIQRRYFSKNKFVINCYQDLQQKHSIHEFQIVLIVDNADLQSVHETNDSEQVIVNLIVMVIEAGNVPPDLNLEIEQQLTVSNSITKLLKYI